MQFAEVWSKLSQKKIGKKDLIIAILIFVILALLFFGWYYFMAKKDPFDGLTSLKSNYQYKFSIYDPKHLQRPLGVAVSQLGDIFVADSVNHRVAVFDRNGAFRETLGGFGAGPGQFNYPTGLAVSGHKLYVADFYNQRVQVLSFSGKQLSVIPSARDRQKLGPVVMPVTVATDSQGNLYVSDLSSQRILVFNDTGELVRSFGKAGANPGEISYVNGIAVDDKGKIFLANSNNGRIDQFAPDGTFIGTVPGSKGLTNPKGITIHPEGRSLYVADIFSHRVIGINTDGNVFETIGTRGLDVGTFNFPTAVTIDSQGRLYVADRENNRVQVFTR